MTENQTVLSQIERRQKLEQIFAAAYLERDLYHREQELKIRWPEDLRRSAEITLRLQTPQGRIYGELQPFLVRPGAVANLGKVYRVPDGVYQVMLMPRLEEYYEQGMKIQHPLNLQIANGMYSSASYGTELQRRQEALDDAARRNLHLFSEIAKMALERWALVKPPVIEQALALINQQTDDSAISLLGLLGMVAHFGHDPNFPASLLLPSEVGILGFKYGLSKTDSYPTESQQIVLYACEMLAGQLYPDHRFANSGQFGAWHQMQGEAGALAWLQKSARTGFRRWGSEDDLAQIVLGLTHLVDWATNDRVAELAAVVLDKLFFTLALNSQRGVFGFTGYDGRLAATTGMARLLWGMGAFNNQIVGTVSLAGSGYELPMLLAQIATDQPAALWSREQHASALEGEQDRATGSWAINKVTYKTAEYLLCSVQDYRPGEVGDQQHLWQATFSPDAVVFVNQPATFNVDPTQQSTFWRGQVALPRVAQWQDVLVALHKLPADDPLGFTHAYFPTTAFEEYTLHAGWAFARLGNGYLALRSSGEMQFMSTGMGAGRELRVYGPEQTWFLHLGRAAQDGNFADFQAKILALEIVPEPLAFHADTLRGETIDFGWTGPLLVNELEQPLAGFRQYDNPYCVADLGAQQMEIRFGAQVMRLDFSDETK